MKTVFFELEKWEEEFVKDNLGVLDVSFVNDKLTEENAADFKDAQIISIFIYSQITKQILDKLPNLKLITTRSMGFDHIDMNYCKEKGITVSYVPTYGSHTVAEHTFALILAVSRKLITSIEQAKRGDFTNQNLEGFDLFGKTLGVVGTGHIGSNVCKLGISFGMKVLAFNHHQDLELIQKGVKYVSIEDLISSSDIITLHLPHTKETEHIINMENIQKFKKGSILVNTARGALVETKAIVFGLQNGILAAAALDVLEEETALREERELLSSHFLEKTDLKTQLLDHVLLTEPNVIITPHNAFNSKEALQEILTTTIASIKSFVSGTPSNTIE